MVQWIYGRKFLTLSYHAAKLGGFVYCVSGDEAFLLFDEILQGHVI